MVGSDVTMDVKDKSSNIIFEDINENQNIKENNRS